MFERFVVAIESIAASLAANPVAAPADKPAAEAAPPAAKKAAKKAAAKAVEPKVIKQEPAFDYNLLKASVIKLANMGKPGLTAAKALLAEYNVAKADAIPEAQWSEANDKFQAAIDELADEPEEADEDDFA